jgi:hypothetical protein
MQKKAARPRPVGRRSDECFGRRLHQGVRAIGPAFQLVPGGDSRGLRPTHVRSMRQLSISSSTYCPTHCPNRWPDPVSCQLPVRPGRSHGGAGPELDGFGSFLIHISRGLIGDGRTGLKNSTSLNPCTMIIQWTDRSTLTSFSDTRRNISTSPATKLLDLTICNIATSSALRRTAEADTLLPQVAIHPKWLRQR